MQFSLIHSLLVRLGLLALLAFLGPLHAVGAEKKLIVAIFPPPDDPFFKVEADTVVSKAKSLAYGTLLGAQEFVKLLNEKSVKTGQIKATVLQPIVKLAGTAVEEADEYLKTGKTDKPEKQSYDCILVNSDSAKNYRNFDVVQDNN
jgi:ABC-type sugar transport system substrate-binding protein